jgi:hypothetical protein
MFEKNSNQINCIKCLAPFTLASVAIAATSPAAQALQFNFSYASGTTLEQMIGYEIAGGAWASHLSDNVSVNIYVEMTNELPTNVIGGALPGIRAQQSYKTWRNRLQADVKSADDRSISNNLQDEKDKFTAYIDGYKVDNNYQLNLTRANAKALGMLNGSSNSLDGYILMSDLQNTSVSWNYNYQSSNVATNQLDFLSVGIHEIGHVLGYVSGVDGADLLTSNFGDDDDDDEGDEGGDLYVTPLDMFRYSTQSVAAGGSGDPWIDMSIGGNPYFSVDGGKTALGYFGTGEDTSRGGDGEQASHWKHNNSALGIMDPVLHAGQKGNISTLDRHAMDAIGWDLGGGTVNLSTLESQAKQQLAARLGVTVAWLEANPIEAARLLSQNRTQDVNTMIEQSKIYEWGTRKCTATITTNCAKQKGFWSKYNIDPNQLSWQKIETPNSKSTTVPEPSSIMGLGAIALLGISSLIKRIGKNNLG